MDKCWLFWTTSTVGPKGRVRLKGMEVTKVVEEQKGVDGQPFVRVLAAGKYKNRAPHKKPIFPKLADYDKSLYNVDCLVVNVHA